MAVSESQKRASMKYARGNLKRIPLDLPKERYERIKAHAQKLGEGINTFIKRAIDTQIEIDNATATAIKSAEYQSSNDETDIPSIWDTIWHAESDQKNHSLYRYLTHNPEYAETLKADFDEIQAIRRLFFSGDITRNSRTEYESQINNLRKALFTRINDLETKVKAHINRKQ